MIYKIKRTDIFNDQLNSIIFYIADDSGDVDVALNIPITDQKQEYISII